MKRKRREYFNAGVRVIWEVSQKRRKVSVFTPTGRIAVLDSSQRWMEATSSLDSSWS